MTMQFNEGNPEEIAALFVGRPIEIRMADFPDHGGSS